MQVSVVVSQALSAGQSVAVPQPHVPVDMHTCPDEFPPQATHAPPVVPHAPFAEPKTQAPALLQQPPLHGWVAEHAVVHIPLAASHAWSGGQSAALAQPHVPVDRHASPDGLPAHDTHAPLAPHAACAVPGAHAPALQHPP